MGLGDNTSATTDTLFCTAHTQAPPDKLDKVRGVDGVLTALTTLFDLTGSFGYLGVALVMIVAAPELVMPFAGLLVARGELSFAGVLAAGVLGAMAGQGLIYGLSRRVGEGRVKRFFGRYGRLLLVSEGDVERTLTLFDRHENLLVLFGRAVPTVRSLISVPAGVKRMPLARFLTLTALGTALWNAVLLYLGTTAGRNWEQLADVLAGYETVIVVLLGLAAALLLVRRVRAQVVRSQNR